MSKLVVLAYHSHRIYTHPLGLEAGLAELAVAGVTHIGVPWQHRDEPYIATLRQHGLRVVYTIGATERPYAKDFGKCDGICFDAEGGGDPAANATWFANLYRKLDYSSGRIFYDNNRLIGAYSGYPGILYSNQTISERYGCDWGLFHQAFSRGWGWPRPLPVCAVGGIRGSLPGHALDGMPAACPVLHSIATPQDWTAPGVEKELREQIRDRLAWVRRWKAGGGLMVVRAKDGPTGSRWLPEDSLLCKWVKQEIARYA